MPRHAHVIGAALALATLAGLAQAQTLTSLGGGLPQSVTNQQGGVWYVGGSSGGAIRWTVTPSSISTTGPFGTSGSYISSDGRYMNIGVLNNSPQVFGNAATGVSPAFSMTPTLVPTAIAATETGTARLDLSTSTITSLGGYPVVPALMLYGSGSSGSSSGSFLSPTAMSSDGRFLGTQGYISNYNNAAGATIAVSTGTWRPGLWDAQANAGAGGFTVLSTPQRTSSNTWRKRNGTIWDISLDGTVVLGAIEHNVGSVATSNDFDGARQVVWRKNAVSGEYEMTYLPVGTNANGFPNSISTSVGSMHMNDAGTIIVGPAADSSGNFFLGKWTWNAATSTWNNPVSLGTIAIPASWLPNSVTSCGLPPTLTITGMSEDGNTIVGFATYSTCGSFMRGGWIWQAADNVMLDWHDFVAGQNLPGFFETYGPTGDLGNPNRGLPKIGNPLGISPDGSTVVGAQGGNQIIPGATPWIYTFTGTQGCVAPAITSNPVATAFSRCSFTGSSSTVILSAAASGTAPLSFQWNRNGVPLVDGPSIGGGTITGATTFQLRVNVPGIADAGSYTCTITGCGGASATTTGAAVTLSSAVTAPANETCATAINVGEGTTNFNVCGAFANDGFTSCTPFGTIEYADVFYRYTPSFTGQARIQTCASTFDTVIQAYESCGGAELVCNNDVGSRGLVGTSCASSRSLVSALNVTSGVPILIRVTAISTPFSNAANQGVLTISQAPARPANDTCDNATLIGLGTVTGNLAEATDDFTFGADICAAAGNSASTRDVWYRVNAPCGGTFTIDTCGSTITNPMLHVMSDCFGTVIACNDNVGTTTGCTSNQARVSNVVTTGSFLVRVSSSGANVPASGAFNLNVTGSLAVCPPTCGTADFDGDGDSGTDADIEAFFACLAGTCCPTCGTADFDGDGDTGTDADIEAFFRVLAGQPC